MEILSLVLMVGAAWYFFHIVTKILTPPAGYDAVYNPAFKPHTRVKELKKFQAGWETLTTPQLIDERCFCLERYRSSTSDEEKDFWWDAIGEIDRLVQKHQRSKTNV